MKTCQWSAISYLSPCRGVNWRSVTQSSKQASLLSSPGPWRYLISGQRARCERASVWPESCGAAAIFPADDDGPVFVPPPSQIMQAHAEASLMHTYYRWQVYNRLQIGVGEILPIAGRVGGCQKFDWVMVRPTPSVDLAFANVWRWWLGGVRPVGR